MAINPHDIIKVNTTAQHASIAALPLWAQQSWTRSPFHVIRRAPVVDNKIPIGIRGESRGERYAIDIPKNWVESIITPQSLVRAKHWQVWQRRDKFSEIVMILDRLSHELRDYNWGIGGSLGYELTTNIPAVHMQSDIDLILYQKTALMLAESQQIMHLISNFPTLVDMQVQNNKGAFHLREYLDTPNKKILLKTNHGPILSRELWE